MEISYLKIKNIYEIEIRKHVKNKKELLKIEKNKMEVLKLVYDKLNHLKNEWNVKYHIFKIHEPKERVIMSLPIIDKIMNHYVARYLLLEKLERRLDHRNVATRKGYGTSYGRNQLKEYNQEMIKSKNNFYFLKLDIKGYFYHIHHETLLNLINSFSDIEEIKMVENILSSTNEIYVNEMIKTFPKPFKYLYKKGYGLPIGNMTSQFLAIFYLNELDHKIIHDYKNKYYVRYMDDFILTNESKERLVEIRKKIELELKEKYHLEINQKKTAITNCKNGVVFLGHHYFVKNNKLVITLQSKKKVLLSRQVKKISKQYQKGVVTLEEVYLWIKSFLKQDSVHKKYRKCLIEKYWFDEIKK